MNNLKTLREGGGALRKDNLSWVDAKTLITKERFDLFAKINYVRAYISPSGVSSWDTNFYLKTIEAFNGFVEADGSGKIGKAKFLRSFNQLITSMIKNGYKEEFVLPVNKGCVMDGAHRLSVAYVLGYKVPILEVDQNKNNYDYEFFKKRMLDVKSLDYTAYLISLELPNVRVALVWPSVGNANYLKLLSDKVDVFYCKDLYLNETGKLELVKTAYKSEPWLGTPKNNYIGARNKMRWCFENDIPVRVVLFNTSDNIVRLKEDFRSNFEVGKHSIHITDTRDEAIDISQFVFFENSIHRANFCVENRDFEWFNELLSEYKVSMQKKSRDQNLFCVHGSSVLSTYGIREARDLDYITIDEESEITNLKEIGCHNNVVSEKGFSIEKLVTDPDCYFWYRGTKFSSLLTIRNFKRVRNELKDRKDIELIKKNLSGEEVYEPILVKIKRVFTFGHFKGLAKFFLLKLRYKLYKKFNIK